jgi:hypothetical protein
MLVFFLNCIKFNYFIKDLDEASFIPIEALEKKPIVINNGKQEKSESIFMVNKKL